MEIPVEHLTPQEQVVEPEPIPTSEPGEAEDETMSDAGAQPEGVEWNPEPIEIPEQDYKFMNDLYRAQSSERVE